MNNNFDSLLRVVFTLNGPQFTTEKKQYNAS